MKYMGSKARVADDIYSVIKKHRGDMIWVEPFVGGGNMIQRVGGLRIGCDKNEYCIQALMLIRDNPESIPDLITEEYYDILNKERIVDGITGYVGFSMSFGGKFFGGYRREVAGSKGCSVNMHTQSRRAKQAAILQSKMIQGVRLVACDYTQIRLATKCVIYCDPPYAASTGYVSDFDSGCFFDWCREMDDYGHLVFVSEYNAPDDFMCIWEKDVYTTISKQRTKQDKERLFTTKRFYENHIHRTPH